MWEKETIKKVLINQEEIRQRCVELGAEITRDYKGKKPLVGFTSWFGTILG